MILQPVTTPAESGDTPPRARWRIPAWLPFIPGLVVYLLALLLCVTPIADVNGMSQLSWLNIKMGHFSRWVPYDLHLATSSFVSHQTTGYLELMLFLAISCTAYFLCAMLVSRSTNHQRVLRTLLWLAALAAGAIYLFTPGILSNDLYAYVGYGRVMIAHAANPYFVPPSAFPHDPVYPIVAWSNTVSIYGPIWMVVCAALTWLGGTGQVGLVLAFRSFAFIAYLLNIWLVGATLQAMGRSERTVTLGMLLYALNPLILEESCLGAHNDVLMITFILLGTWLGARAERQSTTTWRTLLWPLLAFTLAALVKFSAALLIVLLLAALFVRVLRSVNASDRLQWGPAIFHTLVAGGICLAVGVLLYLPFWLGHSISAIVDSFITTPSAQSTFNSIYYALAIWRNAHGMPAFMNFLLERHVWNVFNLLALIIPLLLGAWYLWREPTIRMVALIALAAMGAFLLLMPWFFAWYVTWLVALLVVCLPIIHSRVGRALAALTLTFSCTALVIYYSNVVGWAVAADRWVIWLMPLVFGLPVAAFILLWVWASYYPSLSARKKKAV